MLSLKLKCLKDLTGALSKAMSITVGAVQHLLDPLGMKKQHGNAWARVLAHRHSFGSRKYRNQSPVAKIRGDHKALVCTLMFYIDVRKTS